MLQSWQLHRPFSCFVSAEGGAPTFGSGDEQMPDGGGLLARVMGVGMGGRPGIELTCAGGERELLEVLCGAGVEASLYGGIAIDDISVFAVALILTPSFTKLPMPAASPI